MTPEGYEKAVEQSLDNTTARTRVVQGWKIYRYTKESLSQQCRTLCADMCRQGPVSFFPRSGCIAQSVEVWLREPASFRSVARSVGRSAVFFSMSGCITRPFPFGRPASQSVGLFLSLGSAWPLLGQSFSRSVGLPVVGRWVAWPLFSLIAALSGISSVDRSVDRFRTVGRSDSGLPPQPCA